MMDLKGLPEGIKPIRFGIAAPDEFELIQEAGDIPTIRKGPRPGASTQIVIMPENGWIFAPRYDVKSLEERFVPAQVISPAIDMVATFHVTNTYEREVVNKVFANLMKVPGYVP